MACCGRPQSSSLNPFVMGDDDGSPAREVVATVALLGARAQERIWVKGTQVQTLIDAGWLQPVE